MSALGSHGGYILAAYALAAVVIASLILSAWLDYRVQRTALARLEERGIRRRSDG